MEYEDFLDEVRRRSGPMPRDEAEAAAGGYMEALRERLPEVARGGLAIHLPDELAKRLKGEGEGEEFSVWEFYERLSQKAGLSLEHSTRYARHVGNVLGVAVPEENLATAREELDPEYWELSERVLPDPQYYGSYEQRPDSLKPSDAPVPNGARRVEIARASRPVQKLHEDKAHQEHPRFQR